MQLPVFDVTAKEVGNQDLEDSVFGIEPNIRDAPGAFAPTRQRPPGDEQYADPWQCTWRWTHAVAPEGHRSRAAGLDPLAAVARWRSCIWPAPAVIHPEYAEEDAAPRYPLRAIGQGQR